MRNPDAAMHTHEMRNSGKALFATYVVCKITEKGIEIVARLERVDDDCVLCATVSERPSKWTEKVNKKCEQIWTGFIIYARITFSLISLTLENSCGQKYIGRLSVTPLFPLQFEIWKMNESGN